MARGEQTPPDIWIIGIRIVSLLSVLLVLFVVFVPLATAP
jgi:hypothetical protein